MTTTLLTDLTPDIKGKSIALIGIGRMGTGMGLCLLRHGAKLLVKPNIRRIGIDRLIEAGASEVAGIPQLGKKAKIVILSLPSSREVESVCLTEGLFKHLKAGSLVIDCTTSTPQSTLALAKEANSRGIYFVDAPVTRSPEQAEQGKLNAMVGADPETFTQAAPILAAFCEGIMHVGAVGEGHKMKLVYNGMTMGLAAVAAETCQLATNLGIDLDALRTMVSRGATNSGIFQRIAAFTLGEEADALAISISHAAKDIAGTLELAGKTHTNIPVLSAASAKLHRSVLRGKGDLTLPHIVQLG